MSALRLDDGRLAWFVQLAGPLVGPPTREAGHVAFGSHDHLLVVDARSGLRLLQQRLPSPLAAAPRSDGVRVFVPLLVDNRMAVIHVDSGMQAWDVRLPAAFTSGPVFVDGRLMVVPCEDGLRGFVTDTEGRGRQAWVRPTGRPVAGLVRDGGRVLVSTAGLELLAVEGASGRVAWSLLPGERLAAAPVVVGDVVALGTATSLQAVDRIRGGVLWARPAEQPVAALGGMLVVRRADGALATRDAATGALLDGGGRPTAWHPLDARHVADVRGGELRVWTVAR